MDLDQIRAFLATLDAGSLSGAARVLHRTQPGITRLIQSLEAELGSELLDRSCKPARPTARGLAMVDSARRVLEAVGDLEAVALHRRRAQRLPFRLGVSHALLRFLGEPSVLAWKQTHARLDLTVEADWNLGLLQRLRDGRLDAVLSPFPGAGYSPRRSKATAWASTTWT